MSLKLARAALPLSAGLLLLTTGCFRQAGAAIEPTSTTSGELAITAPGSDPAAVLLENPTDAVVLPGEPVTEEAPPAGPATSTPPPTPTIGLVIVTSTPQYITPQMPLGFTTPDTPAPTVAPVIEPTGLTRTPGQPSFILPNSPDLLPTPTNLPGVEDECVHVVQSGDSLYLIAVNNGFTVDELLAANPDLGDSSAVLQPGDPIQLPLPDCASAEATSEAGTDAAAPAPTRAASTATPASADGAQVYVVQPGDVLYNIAIQFGTTVNAIVQANNLANPNALQVGQELIIPPSS